MENGKINYVSNDYNKLNENQTLKKNDSTMTKYFWYFKFFDFFGLLEFLKTENKMQTNKCQKNKDKLK